MHRDWDQVLYCGIMLKVYPGTRRNVPIQDLPPFNGPGQVGCRHPNLGQLVGQDLARMNGRST